MFIYDVFGQAAWSLLATLIPFALPVHLETISGDVVQGDWSGVTETAVRVLTEDGTRRDISFDQLVSLRPGSDPPSRTGPKILVVVSGGSEVLVQDFQTVGSDLRIEPRRQESIRLPLDRVRSVRFRVGSAATDPQWLGLVDSENRSDLIVIRRPGDQLDGIEGVVVGLDNENLKFELDGETIDAPLEKLEGIVIRSSGSNRNANKVRIEDVWGSVFLTEKLEATSANDRVEFLLAGDVRHAIPIDQIKSIAWASGLVTLSSLEATNRTLTPYLATKVDDSLLAAWFSPQNEGDDLLATSGGSITYRVEPGFRFLAGSVRKRGQAVRGGSMTIRIDVDDDVAWEQELADLAPKGFRIPIEGARSVRLSVLPGDDGEVGDQVRFLRPRLSK